MALRVLYLLANGLVDAPQILGLTFTRKAAGELAERIREHIAGSPRVGLAGDFDPFDPPTVSTYNSFANAIYRDNAPLIGRESDGIVLGEASAWQLARRMVLESGDGALATSTSASTHHRARAVTARPRRARGRPRGGAGDALAYGAAPDALPAGTPAYKAEFDHATTGGAAAAAAVARGELRGAKAGLRRRAVLRPGRARARDPRRVRRVVADFRDRYRVVLLDEYQDTSVVQTRLLARLFAGGAVMAVGDPHQSIYGWRGASAATSRPSPATSAAGERCAVRAQHQLAQRHRGARRRERGRRPARRGLQHRGAAARAVADRGGTGRLRLRRDDRRGGRRGRCMVRGPPRGRPPAPSAAMLLRSRRTMPVFLAAMRRQGSVPRARSRRPARGARGRRPRQRAPCPHDAGAGAELVRLLAGARWRIGLADLDALRRLARWLAQRDHAQQRLDEEVPGCFGRSVAEGENASLVDALDFLGAPEGHGMDAAFSPEGLARLRRAGLPSPSCAPAPGGELGDFVHLVIEALDIDIEVDANEGRPGSPRCRRSTRRSPGTCRSPRAPRSAGSSAGSPPPSSRRTSRRAPSRPRRAPCRC